MEEQLAHQLNERSCRKVTSTDIPYFDWSYGDRWRPNGKAPISSHRDCGSLLYHVAWATEGRPEAFQRVKFVMNTLHAWLIRENSECELDLEAVEGVCFPSSSLETRLLVNLSDLIDQLESVKRILVECYPTGKALFEIFEELNRAIISILKWDGVPQGKIHAELIPRVRIRPQMQA